jgi:hypothetical protein
MRLRAYPEIGRRITISQGRGVNGASNVRGGVHDKLVVGSLRWSEGMLGEAYKPIVRMIEQAKAAFADLDGLLVPSFGEEGAVGSERFDEDLDLGVAKGAGEVGAKFGEQASRPVLPGGNELASGRLEKHVAQEVALTVPVQPAVKKPRRRVVPAARVPQAVEPIGRAVDCFDSGDQGGRRVRGGPARPFGIETPGKLEQIIALGARQGERLRDAAQGVGGGLHRAALFDPRAPGHANAGKRSKFFAAKTRGSTPCGRRDWPHALAMGAHEFAEEPPLIRFEHGSCCNRIKFNLVTV